MTYQTMKQILGKNLSELLAGEIPASAKAPICKLWLRAWLIAVLLMAPLAFLLCKDSIEFPFHPAKVFIDNFILLAIAVTALFSLLPVVSYFLRRELLNRWKKQGCQAVADFGFHLYEEKDSTGLIVLPKDVYSQDAFFADNVYCAGYPFVNVTYHCPKDSETNLLDETLRGNTRYTIQAMLRDYIVTNNLREKIGGEDGVPPLVLWDVYFDEDCMLHLKILCTNCPKGILLYRNRTNPQKPKCDLYDLSEDDVLD